METPSRQRGFTLGRIFKRKSTESSPDSSLTHSHSFSVRDTRVVPKSVSFPGRASADLPRDGSPPLTLPQMHHMQRPRREGRARRARRLLRGSQPDVLLNEDSDDEVESGYDVCLSGDEGLVGPVARTQLEESDVSLVAPEAANGPAHNSHSPSTPNRMHVPKMLLNGSLLGHHEATDLVSSTPEKAAHSASYGSLVGSNNDGDNAEHKNNNIAENDNIGKTDHNNKSVAEDADTGILSKLLSSFNLKSVTDLHEEGAEKKAVELDGAVEDAASDASSGASVRSAATGTSSAHMVSFKPVKRTLLQSLGNGSLSLEQFPDSATTMQAGIPLNSSLVGSTELRSPPLSPRMQSPNRESFNASESELSRTRLRAESNNDSDRSIHPTSSGDDQRRSKSIKSKLRKSTGTIGTTLTGEWAITDKAAYESKKSLYSAKLAIDFPSEKRQRSFHTLFTEIPPEDLYLAEYTCALRKDILIQGKLYITEHNLCFHSNIIGLVTHITIPFNKVYKIQKKKTMGIPNAIEFSNIHERFTFASFMSRDSVFDLVSKVWRANSASVNGNLQLGIDEEDLESLDPVSDYPQDEEDDEEEPENGDEALDTTAKSQQPTSPTQPMQSQTQAPNLDNGSDSSSDDDMVKEGEGDNEGQGQGEGDENDGQTSADANTTNNANGPLTHPPTSINYKPDPSDVTILDDSIPAPVGVVFNLLFGPDTAFYKDIIAKQGNINIPTIPAFDANARQYQYVKPLNAPVGPKETRCLVEETVEKADYTDHCLVTQLTASPDVPSGNSFKVRTRIWLSWGPANSTKIFVVTNVQWSSKSWIKGVIEKNTYSGQKDALGILSAEVKKRLQGARPSLPVRTTKKKLRVDVEVKESVPELEVVAPPPAKTMLDLVMDQMDVKMGLIIFLFGWMLWNSLRRPSTEAGLYTSKSLAASEADLWEWVESRDSSGALRKEHTPHALTDTMKKQDLRAQIDFEERKLDALRRLLS